MPRELIGRWSVETAYVTPGPTAISAEGENVIRRLHFVHTRDHLQVCGKTIRIQRVETTSLNDDELLQTYGFLPRLIHMKAPMVEVTLNSGQGTKACGEYENLGAHLLFDRSGHLVMEVANSYFSLKKQ